MQATNSLAPPRPKPLWRHYLAMLLPMMLTNVLQSAAGTIDGIFLGQWLGVEAIGAVSAFFPVFFLLLALVVGLSAGATVLVGQAWGAGDRARVRAIAATAVTLALATALPIAIVGAGGAGALMRALGTPAPILADATRYARLMLAGMPILFLLWLATSLSRGVGDALTPLWALALATAVSLALTPALLRGWGGLPRLGVASAAVSTLLAFSLAISWLVLRWRRGGHPLAPDRAWLRQLRPDRAIARRILQIGVPSSLQMLTMALAELALLGLVNRHGAQATAAYGAVTQAMSWLQLPAMSLGISATILASHAIGAGHGDRLGRIVRTGQGLNLVLTGALAALAYAFAPAILGLFLTDPAVAALAGRLLDTVAWTVIVLGAVNILTGTMRASGTVLVPAALGAAAILGIELPAAWWLDARLGLQGIWWSYALAFAAMLALQGAYFALVWRHRPIRRLA